jgi:hypothetical protein
MRTAYAAFFRSAPYANAIAETASLHNGGATSLRPFDTEAQTFDELVPQLWIVRESLRKDAKYPQERFYKSGTRQHLHMSSPLPRLKYLARILVPPQRL